MTPRETIRKRPARAPTPNERRKFLLALSEGWSVRRASLQAGLAFQRFYELRVDDESFAAAWTEAYEQGTQRLEDEATRRAVEGYDEETRDANGKLIRSVRRFDSALLQQQLKARRPAIYRESAGIEVKTPAVFVLDSSFGREGGIEVPPAKPQLALPSGEERDK
jgi:hypothetical protein